MPLLSDFSISFYWVVFSANPQRAHEAQASAETFLAQAQKKAIIIKNFRDGYFPYLGESKEVAHPISALFQTRTARPATGPLQVNPANLRYELTEWLLWPLEPAYR